MSKILCLTSPSGLLLPLASVPEGMRPRAKPKRPMTLDERRGAYLLRNLGPEKLADMHVEAVKAREAAWKRQIDARWNQLAKETVEELSPASHRKKIHRI